MDIHGPWTVQVITDYLRIWELTEDVQLWLNEKDRFCWRFSADGVYSASSAYKAMFIGSVRLCGAREL